MEILLVLYFISLFPFALYGLHRLDLLTRLLRRPRRTAASPGGEWPRVTVQLPVFNEGNVVERLIRSVAELDYPRDRLQIQVLDDSTDDTPTVVSRTLDDLPPDLDIVHLRRRVRSGFKAGALAHGLESASGELVAIFDADFVPEPDFLCRAVPPFTDPGVGMVQCRWGYLNAEYSVLTGAQTVLVNAHFGVEHAALQRSGSFFNFNGTAGIWRRSTIEDAGGWTFDSLTEDLDLSYRAQLRGWCFVYLDPVIVPSELPVDIRAFRTQQYRWSKGMTQVARRTLPRLWRSRLGWRIKVDGTFHLLSNVGFLFVCLMSLVIVPAAWWGSEFLKAHLWTRLLSGFFMATNFGAIALFLLVAQASEGRLSRVALTRWVTIFPVGVALAVTGARGLLSGLRRGRTPFERTAKLDVVGRTRRGPRDYRQAVSVDVLVEAFFALYHLLWFTAILRAGRMDLLFFSLVFMPGYVYFLALELGGLWRTPGGERILTKPEPTGDLGAPTIVRFPPTGAASSEPTPSLHRVVEPGE